MLFGIFSFVPFLIFLTLVSTIIKLFKSGIIGGSSQTTIATVLSKRAEHDDNNTLYYTTFQLTKSVIELTVNSDQYNLLMEGDRGYMVYNGIMLVSFKRTGSVSQRHRTTVCEYCGSRFDSSSSNICPHCGGKSEETTY